MSCVLALASPAIAADAPPALVVNKTGAQLFSRQDEASPVLATLRRGERLTPLAQGIGPTSWYMVRVLSGDIGWVKASDVDVSYEVTELFKENIPSGPIYTWSAVTSAGRTFAGTFTADADPATGTVSGIWTLRDSAGKNVMGGSWSANKTEKGWNGAWSARVLGSKNEYSGTWTTSHRFPTGASFADLFEAAAKEVIGGEWLATGNSGSWSIYRPK
ncbi:MAG TPA: hypothetical protein VNL14_23085 [Candidatus Acidoferrales bacterium]|nr:hypothetical protein [Candidatus Acidoferrales bacterium]